MKKIWYWVIGIVVVLLVSGLLIFGLGALRYSRMTSFMQWDRTRALPDGGYGYWPQRGGMHMTTPFTSPFMGLLGGLLMFLLPVGVITLIVLGVIMLVRAGRNSSAPAEPPAALTCPNCGADVKAEWKVCPHCGEGLGDA
ncbi:zinc ribbon domain-containing protein [bacterium]|nr:zinc ribbon domain-containing protein [bacterium]